MWKNLFSFLKIKHYTLRVIYRCRGYICSKITYVNTEANVSIRSVRIVSLTSADYPFDKCGLCLWKLHSMPFYWILNTIPPTLCSLTAISSPPTFEGSLSTERIISQVFYSSMMFALANFTGFVFKFSPSKNLLASIQVSCSLNFEALVFSFHQN